ncbi:hypothetical protein [Cohaesibacter celericrescens]|uniref:Uncharacterized protein n=1 Tax=Cohaesibacter celericrescens TaxID=2067669 RepID=A0A2N5XM57_9HYPH|nr:hypothetical protein [Cohaesibacter celericrescens]PLW75621.1 hypothetical protein C0081_18390 [Cohaesibacter celericrescens]
MLFTLLGTLIAGVGAAGFIVLVYKYILRKPRPKAAIPFAAAAGMMLLQILLDYGWYARATADFGEDVVILRSSKGTSLVHPLSYIVPRTDRFLAFDKNSIRTNDTLPGIKLGALFQVEKEGPTTEILQLIDCLQARRADWSGEMPLSSQAMAEQAKWFDLESDDPLFVAACK